MRVKLNRGQFHDLQMNTCGAGHDDSRADNAEDDVAVESVEESFGGDVHSKSAHRIGQVKEAGEVFTYIKPKMQEKH